MKKKYNYILWDWNGTLLDDVDTGVSIINKMLGSRKMKTLDGKHEYRKVFCFPVKDYYRKVGFDFEKESFEDLSVEFIDAYNSQELKLFPYVKETLQAVKEKSITQLILSASEGTVLKSNIKFLNLDGFFADYLTLDNIYASGKTIVAGQWLTGNRINPSDVLIVGDTLHDLDVARNLDCDCILVANGHQYLPPAAANGASIVKEIKEVLNYL